MPKVMDAESPARLQKLFALIGDELDLPARRESFATYAMGILGDAGARALSPSLRGRVLIQRPRMQRTNVFCTSSRTRSGATRT